MSIALPTLERTQMLEIFLSSEAAYNGQFIVGVHTTGIYCLPSCKARKPRPENVSFYASLDDARAAGLRACKKCRPDQFYLGEFAGETLTEGLLDALRLEPQQYRNVESVVAASGVGQSKLYDLFRVHLHTTPLEALTRARLEAACRALLRSERPVTEIAFEVGFESLSSFHDNFRASLFTTPLEYRRIREALRFEVRLPEDYPRAFVLRHLARDGESLSERVEDQTYHAAWWIAGQPCVVSIALEPERASVRLHTDPPSLEALPELYRRVLAVLGLTMNTRPFETLLEGNPALSGLLEAGRGLRFPLIASPWDGLVRAIVGQQITTTFAATLRLRLTRRVGVPTALALTLPPTPEAVAALEPDDLLGLGFTRSRADYLLNAARAVQDGRLPLEALRHKSATRLERTLLAQRGIGPWTAHYLMMQAYGLADCVPVGDTGVGEALKRLHALEARPDPRGTLERMEVFRPYRSLATWSLWQSLHAQKALG